jgi:ribosomal-protein-alanine N-acetyltransferase
MKMLETKRLIIQAPIQADLPHYVELHMHPDVRKLMYTRAKDIEQIQDWLSASIEHQKKHGFCVGTVFDKAAGNFIGRAGLARIEEGHADIDGIAIDCYLLPAYWRNHYALEILKACFTWGFNQLALDKIVATVYSINLPAQKLAENAGMKFIGNHMYDEEEFMWYEIIKGCKKEA